MNNPDSILLAKTLHSARQLTKFYLSHTTGLDVQKRFKVEGFETNSIHWIVAHQAWGENFIILNGVKKEGLDIAWFNAFKIGNPHPEKTSFPNFEQTVKVFDDVHKKALDIINSLSPEELQQDNFTGLEFGGGKSNEALIRHAIRHEAMHAGHLSWLLRMHGVKKII